MPTIFTVVRDSRAASTADCAAVRVHLDTCNPCLEKYDLQRTVKAVVARSCSEAAPADLRARVMMRVREVQIQISEG